MYTLKDKAWDISFHAQDITTSGFWKKRPPCWNFTSGFNPDLSSSPACDFASAYKLHPNRTTLVTVAGVTTSYLHWHLKYTSAFGSSNVVHLYLSRHPIWRQLSSWVNNTVLPDRQRRQIGGPEKPRNYRVSPLTSFQHMSILAARS